MTETWQTLLMSDCFTGVTLHLETWNGWIEFLRACLRGHKHTFQLHLFQEKPVLRSDNTVFGFNVVIAPKRNSLQGMI